METLTGLRHLAIVADRLPATGPPGPVAREAIERAAALVATAFAAAGSDLRALTFFSPQVRDWVRNGSPGVAEACASGLAGVRAAAAAAGAAFRLLGRGDRLPPALRDLDRGEAGGAGRCVGWFLDYGSRDEILRATARLGGAVGEEAFAALLDTAGLPDPDLILYAGGDFEPKDFLLWQGSYAELWHTPAPWGAFTEGSLREALADFTARQRRFGG